MNESGSPRSDERRFTRDIGNRDRGISDRHHEIADNGKTVDETVDWYDSRGSISNWSFKPLSVEGKHI